MKWSIQAGKSQKRVRKELKIKITNLLHTLINNENKQNSISQKTKYVLKIFKGTQVDKGTKMV